MADDVKGSTGSKLAIFFFSFPSKGHMIPMVDLAKLFSRRGVKAILITTPHNEPSFQRSINKTQKLGFDISVVTLHMPLKEVGLPEDCQNYDTVISSPDMLKKYWMATRMLEKQFEELIEQHAPNCVITDTLLPWTVDVATKFGIPRMAFHGTSHFAASVMECVKLYKPYLNVSSDFEPFRITNFPGEITAMRAQLPDFIIGDTEFGRLYVKMMEAEVRSLGVVMNTFYELEPDYADCYWDVLKKRSWRVGPLTLCNQEIEERGNIGEDDCLTWLDSKEDSSVVYLCFGSLTEFNARQLHEIALGLEASGQQFVWVVRKDETVGEGKDEWLPQGYKDRMQEKGLIIRGWAPQVSILNHKAVGGFVTHCGWNSNLEAISAGVPMATWPVLGEQFLNEMLLNKVLRIGIPVGVERWMSTVTVERGRVEKAVRSLMVGEEAKEMRIKARELSKMAKRAVQEGGSSYSDLTALLEELKSAKLVTC